MLELKICRCLLCNRPDYSGLQYGHLGGRRDTLDLSDLLFTRGDDRCVDTEKRDYGPAVRCHACLGTGYWVLVLDAGGV